MMPFPSWIQSMKIRTRVDFLILYWMFVLSCFLFFIRQCAHHATASRQSYREYCLFNPFFFNVAYFCSCGLTICPMQMVPIHRKNISRLNCSLFYCLYSFLSVYNTCRSPTKLTKRHLFSFSLLLLPVCAFLFLYIFYLFFNINFSPLSFSVSIMQKFYFRITRKRT